MAKGSQEQEGSKENTDEDENSDASENNSRRCVSVQVITSRAFKCEADICSFQAHSYALTQIHEKTVGEHLIDSFRQPQFTRL